MLAKSPGLDYRLTLGEGCNVRGQIRSTSRATLRSNGVPGDFAAMLADFDACAANGALSDDGRDLSRLIGRPTTPLSAMVAGAVASA